MVKKFLKKRSKRVKARQRYKVEKKVRDHHRKMRKEAKKSGNKKRTKKDPGIPRTLPFRDKVVAEALEAKAQAEEARRVEKEKLREQRKRTAEEATSDLTNLVKQADQRSRNFEAKQRKTVEEENSQGVASRERSTAAYYHDLKKVIEKSDVLLEVLDARDPIGTRCNSIEQRILSSGKRLILVMNKIDLAPKEIVQQWLRILQSELPCVAFKASTQTQRKNLSQRRGGHFRSVKEDTSKSASCFGAESLLKILGNYCRIKDIRTSITVGIVGLPNTGKSSIINSLKRTKVCQVGAQAGVTRNLQEINLDKHIRMIDSPGVIFSKNLSPDEAVLRNCINPETVEDAHFLVDVIVNRCSHRCIMLAYNLQQFETTAEFLSLMAHRWGKIKKGGIPDLNRAAKIVLHDWNSGKLGYYTEPPSALQPIVTDKSSAEVVTEFAKEFNLEEITEEQFSALQTMANETSVENAAKLSSIGPLSFPENFTELAISDENKDKSENETDMIVSTKVDEQRLLERKVKKAQRKVKGKDSPPRESEETGTRNSDDDGNEEGNLKQANRSRQLEAKRAKKAAKKAQNQSSVDEDWADELPDSDVSM